MEEEKIQKNEKKRKEKGGTIIKSASFLALSIKGWECVQYFGGKAVIT